MLDAVMWRDRHKLAQRVASARRDANQPRERLAGDLRAAVARAEQRRASIPVIAYPDELPITPRRDELVAAVREHQVVIVEGETGSGKSTQLPKMCLEAGRGVLGMIGHTQPRRVAARTIAERVADELGTDLGATVGYAVRFTDRVGDLTLVKVMTDGILLAETQRDRWLNAYDTLIIDEAHERSLNIDFLLGYVKQLLVKRPELKLIVTSATIDTQRFAEHFDAPIVSVSGRMYPVEIRYRPFGPTPCRSADPALHDVTDDRDQVGAITDAVVELQRESDGDILVFLSGEREIHDAADALRRADLRFTEVIPLYARLSAAEQHRVFQPHTGRRVVLATNVAETSLTVPGVRNVIDTGTARISRYSRRLKVQRLPIEPISQASANQRSGRCGRLGPGICVRLYCEDDFAERPEFTEPEILRTNLASVILQMTALGLGDVASFPFVDPPDPRSVGDGIALLRELGALAGEDEASGRLRLTSIGRRLARLPVDPRLGRMVIEADRLGCAHEVMVVTAALSIQDPRERPTDAISQATEAHQRFVSDDGSDFMAFVRLWDHLRERQRALSSSQFRKLCRTEFLNYLRVREWQDIFSQMRHVAGELGVRMNTEPAHPDHVHQALLAGLLSQIGMRDGQSREYRGARGAKFTIGAGSAQAKRLAGWVMAAELVETNRLWARTCARIQPEWAERLGAHLVKRSYGEPEWDPKRGSAVVDERVTLFGLPIVNARRVGLARVDPGAARTMFIQHALVAREWSTHHEFAARNAELLDEVRDLEERTRRLLLVDDGTLAEFFDRRIPDEVTGAIEFDRWWRRTRADQPHLLDLGRGDVTIPTARHVTPEAFPTEWSHDGAEFPVTYEYAPGAQRDGVTVHIPVALLNQVRPEPFEWLVPGLRAELIAALVKSLPKGIRRDLVPAAAFVDRAVRELDPANSPSGLLTALAASLSAQSGRAISAADFAPDQLPPHLRTRFVVEDSAGHVVASGYDLAALQRDLRPAVRAAVAAATGIERAGITTWDVGDIPSAIDADVGDGQTVRGYPALVDDGQSVSLRVLTTAEAAERAMWNGVRRLLLLTVPLPRKAMAQTLSNATRLALARLGWSSAVDLVDDCVTAAVDHVMLEQGFPPTTAAGFEALQREARRQLHDLGISSIRAAALVVRAASDVLDVLERLVAASIAASVADARRHLTDLVHPGFVTEAGTRRLDDLLRYVKAIERRLQRLPEDPARDRRGMATVHALASEYRAAVRERRANSSLDRRRELDEVRWMIEELRVSTFAQALGTAYPVSVQRIRRELQSAGLAAS
jgi:ATP-dependent helicase HrpA